MKKVKQNPFVEFDQFQQITETATNIFQAIKDVNGVLKLSRSRVAKVLKPLAKIRHQSKSAVPNPLIMWDAIIDFQLDEELLRLQMLTDEVRENINELIEDLHELIDEYRTECEVTCTNDPKHLFIGSTVYVTNGTERPTDKAELKAWSKKNYPARIVAISNDRQTVKVAHRTAAYKTRFRAKTVITENVISRKPLYAPSHKMHI